MTQQRACTLFCTLANASCFGHSAGALVFTLGAKPAVVGAWNCRNLVPLDRRVTLGVRFDLEVELEQSVPDATEWTLVPWFVGRRSNWGGTIARLKLDFYLEVRDHMRRLKPGLKIITGPGASAGYFLEYATTSGQSVEQSMREFGWDFGKFHAQEGLYTIPWLQGSGLYMFAAPTASSQYEMHLKWTRANTEQSFLKIGDGALERMAMVHYGWLELERLQQQTLPERPRWQVPFQYTMEGMPQGDNALEPYVQPHRHDAIQSETPLASMARNQGRFSSYSSTADCTWTCTFGVK